MKVFLYWLMPLWILTACHSNTDYEYLNSRVIPNLEVPPDLTQVTPSDKFEIPPNFSSAIDETLNSIPVLAQVDSIRLEGSADFYWLSVDTPVENLYQTIKNFWASEGFALVVDEPVIGIMQTEWLFKREGGVDKDKNFLVRLFEPRDLSASQDQFRTRLARDSNTDTVRVYIAHRSMQYKHQVNNRKNEVPVSNDWSFSAPEPELEIEMLSRLMVYLGLEQTVVESQLEKAKLFAPRASIHHAENETVIWVTAVQQQTWNRLMHELDRLGIEVVRADPVSGLSGDGIVVVNKAYEIPEKTDDLTATLSSERTERLKRDFVLIVSEDSPESTRISLQLSDGRVDTSQEGLALLNILYTHIR